MAKITARKRHTIRRSELSKLKKNLLAALGDSAALFEADNIEKADTSSGVTLYLIDKIPQIMGSDDWVFPTLRGAVRHPFTNKCVVVDSGAVPFMAKGADLMRPGVISVSPDVRKGEPIAIVEERYKKPLAIAIALFDAEEMEAMETGKVAHSIHHVGDELWNIEL